MRKEEAVQLIARVQQDAPEVLATLDVSKVSAVGHGYHVQLRYCQREFVVNYASDWHSIWLAWQQFTEK